MTNCYVGIILWYKRIQHKTSTISTSQWTVLSYFISTITKFIIGCYSILTFCYNYLCDILWGFYFKKYDQIWHVFLKKYAYLYVILIVLLSIYVR